MSPAENFIQHADQNRHWVIKEFFLKHTFVKRKDFILYSIFKLLHVFNNFEIFLFCSMSRYFLSNKSKLTEQYTYRFLACKWLKTEKKRRKTQIIMAPDKAFFFFSNKKYLVIFPYFWGLLRDIVCYGYWLEAPHQGTTDEFPHITKTRLFKYIENFTSKNWKFSDKKVWYFSYFCSKHRLWVLVRTAST